MIIFTFFLYPTHIWVKYRSAEDKLRIRRIILHKFKCLRNLLIHFELHNLKCTLNTHLHQELSISNNLASLKRLHKLEDILSLFQWLLSWFETLRLFAYSCLVLLFVAVVVEGLGKEDFLEDLEASSIPEGFSGLHGSFQSSVFYENHQEFG